MQQTTGEWRREVGWSTRLAKVGFAWLLVLSALAQAEEQRLFRDDFDGEGVGEQWEILNPDPDNAIVEEGSYQVIAQVPRKKLFDATNMLLYRGTLPREYVAEARVLLTQEDWCSSTKAPFVGLVLQRDGDNAIALVAANSTNCDNADAVQFIHVEKGSWRPGFSETVGKRMAERPVVLRLERKGREVIGYVQKVTKKGKPYWYRVGIFPLIHADDYRIGLIAARSNGNTHEELEKVDWFELRDRK